MVSRHWRECRKDFQEHDTQENRLLWARWEPLSETWMFGGLGAQGEPERIFKSLANKAAKRLRRAPSGADSNGWGVWLNALRDENRNFEAQPFHTSLPVEEWERLGLPVSKGTIVTANVTDEMAEANRQIGFASRVGVQRRKEFDGIAGTLTDLFATSANYCLELESRTPEGGPEPDEPAGVPVPSTVPGAAVAQSALGKQRRYNAAIEGVKKEIRESREAGLTHLEICERLANKPRPANAAWKELSWPQAFRNPKYRSAVKSWIARVS